eukprot:6029556-Pyramimonas_sp.AAC.1
MCTAAYAYATVPACTTEPVHTAVHWPCVHVDACVRQIACVLLTVFFGIGNFKDSRLFPACKRYP